jgi:hypothetical protein
LIYTNIRASIDPTKASITLAKLQNPVKKSFDATNDSLKESHSSLNKYTKALDKVRIIACREREARLTGVAVQRSTASQYRI